MMWFFIIGSIPVIILILAIDAVVKVPYAHYGIITRLGERQLRVLREGWNLVLPFVDRVELVSYKIQTLDVAVPVTSKDGWKIDITGSAKWRPDKDNKEVMNPRTGKKEPNVLGILEVPEETITKGLNDAVKNYLGQVAGQHNAEDFISKRRAIHDIVSSVLLLDRPPHLDPNVLKTTEPGDGKLPITETFADFLDASGEVELAKVTAFYERYRAVIRKILENQDQDESHSAIEKLYRIIVQTFDLSAVKYSDESAKALELTQQKKLQAEAQESVKQKKIKYMQDLIAGGSTPADADYAANVMLDLVVPKQVIEIQGGGGSIPIINIGGQPAQTKKP
jgi:hypothetical protein